MRRKCEYCGKIFESEGHELWEWLTLCHNCNKRRRNYAQQFNQLPKKAKSNNQITKLGINASKALKVPTIRAKNANELLKILGEK